MYRWSFSTFLLFALISASTVPAAGIDDALAKEEKRQVSLSTGVTAAASSAVPADTTTTVSSEQQTSVTSLAPSTTVVVETSQVTSQGSTFVESTTIIASPTIEATTAVVQTTLTRTSTDASGRTTQVPETVQTSVTTDVTYSYSVLTTSSQSQVVQTYVTTEGGATRTATRTSSTLVQVTSSTRVTPTALAQANNSSGGLSSKSKAIIGGVVGGIGGALLLAGLGYTAWRIWGKKRSLHDDDLYDPNANTEKLSSSTDNNTNQPFRSTLDQYHNPGPVNTASNF